MGAQESDIARMLRAADRLAREIMENDKRMPGLAVETVRNVIRQLPAADALSLVGPPAKAKPPLDPRALIG